MPGRVLVFDPIVTNRIMLKAQLSIDFFEVVLAADAEEVRDTVRGNTPDVILVSYQADSSAAFETVTWLKSNANTAYIPVVFLRSSDGENVWDQTHDLMVDDVLCYRATRCLMTTRLNLLIRSKEKIDAVVAQHQTISNMGFAEPNFAFPPTPSIPFTVDLTMTNGVFDSCFVAKIKGILSKDFPNLELRNAKDPSAKKKPANVYLIAAKTVGSEAAFAKIIELRKSDHTPPPSTIFVAPKSSHSLAQKALELSASDFAFSQASSHEIATKIRRVLWCHGIAHHAEQSVSKHLKSALHDPLTGLYNRRYAEQHLHRLLNTPTSKKSTVTAMVIDLDRFKSINDTYGHLTGDAVIQQSAQRLKANLRSADLVARIGGEEFLVVLENASMTRVRHIAERLRIEISSAPFQTESGEDIHVSASIGVSITQSNWSSSKEIIDCADSALYRSKGTGRDCVSFSEKAA
jgi:two-component system cell cycle response regulator